MHFTIDVGGTIFLNTDGRANRQSTSASSELAEVLLHPLAELREGLTSFTQDLLTPIGINVEMRLQPRQPLCISNSLEAFSRLLEGCHILCLFPDHRSSVHREHCSASLTSFVFYIDLSTIRFHELSCCMKSQCDAVFHVQAISFVITTLQRNM